MTAGFISLILAALVGIFKLVMYLISDERKIRQVDNEIDRTYRLWEKAYAANKTVLATQLDRQLSELRAKRRRLTSR